MLWSTRQALKICCVMYCYKWGDDEITVQCLTSILSPALSHTCFHCSRQSCWNTVQHCCAYVRSQPHNEVLVHCTSVSHCLISVVRFLPTSSKTYLICWLVVTSSTYSSVIDVSSSSWLYWTFTPIYNTHLLIIESQNPPAMLSSFESTSCHQLHKNVSKSFDPAVYGIKKLVQYTERQLT